MKQAIEIKPELVYDYGRENVLPRIGFDPSHFTKRELRLMQSLSDRYKDVFLGKMIDVTHAENGAWAKVWNDGKGNNNLINYALSLDEGPEKEAILHIATEHQAMLEQHGIRH